MLKNVKSLKYKIRRSIQKYRYLHQELPNTFTAIIVHEISSFYENVADQKCGLNPIKMYMTSFPQSSVQQCNTRRAFFISVNILPQCSRNFSPKAS